MRQRVRGSSPTCGAIRRPTGCAAGARRWCWGPSFRAGLSGCAPICVIRRGCVADVPPCVELLVAHSLHTPSSVTRYAALLRGLPWSVSAHAKDIWTSEPWEAAEKLADCAWAVTCTNMGAERLRALAP